MQLNRCPVCHSRIGLEQLAQDEAASELLAMLAKLPNALALPLVVYVGLFRSSKRDLANDRALRLLQEVLALHGVLTAALAETVEAMRRKQEQGAFKPLTNHNYLGSVLQSVAASGVTGGMSTAMVQAGGLPVQGGAKSKTSQTIALLQSYPTPAGIEEWFTRTVCGSLAELMLLGLDNVPAADTMELVVQRFLASLWPKRQWRQNHFLHGAKRLHSAFVSVANSTKRWPTAEDILTTIPKE